MAHLWSPSHALMEKDRALANPVFSTSRREVVTTVPFSVMKQHSLLRMDQNVFSKLLHYMCSFREEKVKILPYSTRIKELTQSAYC